MPTSSIVYSAATAITLTAASLANGAYRQSAVIDNSSNLYMNAQVSGSIQTGTNPTAGTLITLFAYANINDTLYTAGCSGSDAAYTADGEELLLRPLMSVRVDATSDQDYLFGPVPVAPAFGGDMPKKWGLVLLNSTGVALNATGTNNFFNFYGVKYTSV